MADWLLAVDESGSMGEADTAVCVAGLLMRPGAARRLEALRPELERLARFVRWPLHAAHDIPMHYALSWRARAEGDRCLGDEVLEHLEGAGVPLPRDPRTADEAALRAAYDHVRGRDDARALGEDEILLALVEVSPQPLPSDPEALNHGRAAVALSRAASGAGPRFHDALDDTRLGRRTSPFALKGLERSAKKVLGSDRWPLEVLRATIRQVKTALVSELRASRQGGHLYLVVASETRAGDAMDTPLEPTRYLALLRVLMERSARCVRPKKGRTRVRLEVQGGNLDAVGVTRLATEVSHGRVTFEATPPVQYWGNASLDVAHVAIDRAAYECRAPLGKPAVSLGGVEKLIAGRVGVNPRRGGLSLLAAHGVARDVLHRCGPGRLWAIQQIPW